MGLNSDYKKKHKPLYEGQTKYHQGYFVPQLHPEKCLTYSPTNNENIYRSGLEFNIFQIFDRCDNITRWATECLAVPYRVVNIDYCLKHKIPLTSPSALKNANYNIDAWIEITNGKETKKVFVEIKPYARLPVLFRPPAPFCAGSSPCQGWWRCPCRGRFRAPRQQPFPSAPSIPARFR